MANQKETLTKKEKAGYIFKIIYLVIFGLIWVGTVVYMIASGLYAFNLPTLLFYVIGGGGAIFCFWCVSWLWKEYKYWLNKEKELEANHENKQE